MKNMLFIGERGLRGSITRRGALGALAASAANLGMESVLRAQAQLKTPPLPSPNGFAGTWRYRSFINTPEHVDDLNKILFGEGVFTVQDTIGSFKATADFGEGDTMEFLGTMTYGLVSSVRFQGKGTGAGNKDWLYDYFGILAPAWPNGVDQTPALVGSVVRTAPHSAPGGKTAQAGRVASFIAIAVKKTHAE